MQAHNPQFVAARLGRSVSTIKRWCLEGRFPHAKLEQTLRGPVWSIPERDLKNHRPPKRGPRFKSERQPKGRLHARGGKTKGVRE
jgi:hypothetical protein